MTLTPEQLLENWNIFINNIETYIPSPRKEKLLEFYNRYEDRLVIYPAAHKKEYHGAFPGGYVAHVNSVVKAALLQHELWASMGSDTTTYTIEELVFSAINHDLGKIGDETYQSYIPQTDNWRKEKLGEDYMFNTNLAFASVPDRGLYLLQAHDIKYTFNEMVAIQIHDGLYDEANNKYLKAWGPEARLRTNLPLILHQADLLAAKLEFDTEWKGKFTKPTQSNNKTTTSLPLIQSNNNKKKLVPLQTVKSQGLNDLLRDI